MTKRILSVLAMMSIAAMMMLSSCTAAGVECGLIGKWEVEDDGVKVTIEITSDDKLIMSLGSGGTQCEITEVDDHEITFEVSASATSKQVFVLEYKNLTCDTVDFSLDGSGFDTFKKVY